MTVLILKKKEKIALIRLLKKLIQSESTPYELTTILEKLSTKEYQDAFRKNKIRDI